MVLSNALVMLISIHTSPKGGDEHNLAYTPTMRSFQSTPPRREVTRVRLDLAHRLIISIHTSPKGGDGVSMVT